MVIVNWVRHGFVRKKDHLYNEHLRITANDVPERQRLGCTRIVERKRRLPGLRSRGMVEMSVDRES